MSPPVPDPVTLPHSVAAYTIELQAGRVRDRAYGCTGGVVRRRAAWSRDISFAPRWAGRTRIRHS
jgi:hypothetical protein